MPFSGMTVGIKVPWQLLRCIAERGPVMNPHYDPDRDPRMHRQSS